jgi:hypothetical protein
MADLTDKQRLFVTPYLKDLNATRAMIRAGFIGERFVGKSCEAETRAVVY